MDNNNLSPDTAPLQEYEKEKVLLRAAQAALQGEMEGDLSALEHVAQQCCSLTAEITPLRRSIDDLRSYYQRSVLFMREAEEIANAYDGKDSALSRRASAAQRNYQETMEQLKEELPLAEKSLAVGLEREKKLKPILQDRIRLFRERVRLILDQASLPALPVAYREELQDISDTMKNSSTPLLEACKKFRTVLYCKLRPRRTFKPVQKEPAVREQKEMKRVHVRWMIHRDLPEVLFTEQISKEDAWGEEDFLRCLRNRDCIGMVAEEDEKVVGFMIYELHENKLFLLNFAVHPLFRKRGVGMQMAGKLIDKLSSHRRTRITLEIRETNIEALLFFQTNGFKATGTKRGFYENSGEDAVIMEYNYYGGEDSEPDDRYYIEEEDQTDGKGGIDTGGPWPGTTENWT